MTPDEVRMLDNQYAILFIRGERPVMDLKYEIMKHPNVKLTEDGGAEPYIHGTDDASQATVELIWLDLDEEEDVTELPDPGGYALYAEFDLEEEMKEEKRNAEKQKKRKAGA